MSSVDSKKSDWIMDDLICDLLDMRCYPSLLFGKHYVIVMSALWPGSARMIIWRQVAANWNWPGTLRGFHVGGDVGGVLVQL